MVAVRDLFAASAGAGRQRDVSPLSFSAIHFDGPGAKETLSRDSSRPSDPSVLKSRTSKSYRKSLAQGHNSSWCSDGISTLNQLSGYDVSDSYSDTVRNASQSAAFDHITPCYSSIPKPPDGLTPARALDELCGSSSLYEHTEALIGARVPYDITSVSWPPEQSKPSCLEKSLDGPDLESVIGWRHHILRSDSELHAHACNPCRIKPFVEPTLISSNTTYSKFVEQLFNRGMLTFKQTVGESTLGCFFILKKNQLLRIILDTRYLNGFCHDPPKTRLPSASCFAALESQEGSEIFFCGCDISNCFYHLRCPEGMDDWFSLPPVAPGLLPHIRRKLGLPMHVSVTPHLLVLPMGWSWSLHIAQKVHEFHIARAGVPREHLLADHSPTVPLAEVDAVVAAYVDNNLSLGH